MKLEKLEADPKRKPFFLFREHYEFGTKSGKSEDEIRFQVRTFFWRTSCIGVTANVSQSYRPSQGYGY